MSSLICRSGLVRASKLVEQTFPIAMPPYYANNNKKFSSQIIQKASRRPTSPFNIDTKTPKLECLYPKGSKMSNLVKYFSTKQNPSPRVDLECKAMRNPRVFILGFLVENFFPKSYPLQGFIRKREFSHRVLSIRENFINYKAKCNNV